MSEEIFLPLFLSTVSALLLGLVAIWISPKIGLLDYPGRESHKQHKKIIPLGGGLVVFLSILMVSLISETYRPPIFVNILISAVIVFVFGLIDDFRGLKPRNKLFGQLLASIVLIYLGVHVTLFSSNIVNYLITFLWLVGITNAFNFLDGGDGLALGTAIITCAFLILASFVSDQNELVVPLIIILGACIGFYVYNGSEAIVFLGDSGAQFLGFSLSALSLAYNPVGYSPQSSWILPILFFSIPIFDTALVTITRIRRKRAIYNADRSHIYHRLVKLGVSPARAINSLHVISALLSSFGLASLNLHPTIAIIGFLAINLTGLIIILFFPRLDSRV